MQENVRTKKLSVYFKERILYRMEANSHLDYTLQRRQKGDDEDSGGGGGDKLSHRDGQAETVKVDTQARTKKRNDVMSYPRQKSTVERNRFEVD